MCYRHRSNLWIVLARIVLGSLGPIPTCFPVHGSVQVSEEPAQRSGGNGSGNTLIPMPILFRGPDTGTGFGAAATYLFRLDSAGGDSAGPIPSPSSLSAVAIYTSKGQIITSIEPVLRLRGDRLRVAGAVELVRFPTSFWGIGNDAPDGMEETYTAEAVNLEGEVLWARSPGWYWGVIARFARRGLQDIEVGGLLDRRLVPGAFPGQIVGVGIGITRDTRDRPVNPRLGNHLEFQLKRFDSFLGSDFDATVLASDLRRYLRLSDSFVFALRILGEVVHGALPFDVLPQLGGEDLMRGYSGGRFRDEALLAGQAEVRRKVWWRVGLVAFAEIGQVASGPWKLRLGGWKPSVGGGLRFAVNEDEGLNLRADLGWGLERKTRAFYLSIGEAF